MSRLLVGLYWYIICQFLLAGLFAASILIPVKFLTPAEGMSHKLLVSLLPIFAITLWGGWLTRKILKLDEFERSLAIGSFAATSAILLWASTCYELLTPSLSLPVFPLFLLAPVAVVLWQLLWEVFRYRYV